MAFFNEFPHTRTYDSDLGWLINAVREMMDKVDNINELHFADPVTWDITTQYEQATVVRDGIDGPLYISKQPVPAGINITNGEYWEILGSFDQMFSGVIKNVQDYGAIGIAGADYTTQVQAAIDDGNIIYFPAGEYSFKGVTITKPVYIFGDGKTTVFKPQHRTETSNQYATMIVATNDFTIDNVKIIGDNSIETETGTQYYQTSIIQSTGKNFRMTRCIIDQIFDTYRLSQGDLEFYDRNGLLLFVSESERAEIDHCLFKQYGGEELIWISRAAARFGAEANVLIHDNTFKDRYMLYDEQVGDQGSVINVLGGNCMFYNNYGENYYQRGSFINLLADKTEVFDNTFINCNMKSWADCCEGFYAKSKMVNIHDNYFEDKNGVTLYGVKFMAVEAIVKNNHLEASCPVKSYGIISASDNTAGRSYIGNEDDWPTYKNCTISDNILVISNNPASATNSGIGLMQTPRNVAEGRGQLQRLVVANNTISKHSRVTTLYPTLYFMVKVDYAVIRENTFSFGGTIGATTSNVYIQGSDTQNEDNTFILKDNIFDNTINGSNPIRVIYMTAANANIFNLIACGNTAISSVTNNLFIASSFARKQGEYNYNFASI